MVVLLVQGGPNNALLLMLEEQPEMRTHVEAVMRSLWQRVVQEVKTFAQDQASATVLERKSQQQQQQPRTHGRSSSAGPDRTFLTSVKEAEELDSLILPPVVKRKHAGSTSTVDWQTPDDLLIVISNLKQELEVVLSVGTPPAFSFVLHPSVCAHHGD